MAVALFTLACTPSSQGVNPPGGLTRAEFVKAMQELRSAPPPGRSAILEKHRITEAEVRDYMKALSADPVALSQLLDSIQVRMDRERVLDPRKFTPPPAE
jgi:hypothetical protein